MKIGILGGSFNPPHKGHIYIAKQAKQSFGLDKVLLMVAGDPPHKSIAFGVSANERLNLTRAAIGGEEGLFACDYEIRRGGVSYMADTLMGLYNGADELYLIVGTDMLKTLHSWRKPETIFALAGIIAVGRPDSGGGDERAAEELRKKFGARVYIADFEGPKISSTDIRKRVYEAEGIAGLVSAGTMRRIYSELLYQSEDVLSYADRLKNTVKPTRFAHSIGTMGCAVELASIWGADGKKARIAGLLHDCAKLGDSEALELANQYGYTPNDEERRAPGLLHGPLGAIRAQRDYGIEDKDIINAIACHVFGKMGMTTLDKILYVADKAEFTRTYDGVENLRRAARENINRAVLMTMDNSISHLLKKGVEPSARSLEIRQEIKRQIEEKGENT